MFKKQKENIDASVRNEIRLRYTEIITGIISSLIALAAVILSIVSFSQSKKLLDYQISQERLPKVVALNYEITNSFEVNSSDEIYSYDLINDLSIPVYNIGVGIAQNCEIKRNTDSVKKCMSESKRCS